jgi:hypothetical protein
MTRVSGAQVRAISIGSRSRYNGHPILGTRPNNHQGHGQANCERANNRQDDCRKQFCFGARFTCQHDGFSVAGSKKPPPGRNGNGF